LRGQAPIPTFFFLATLASAAILALAGFGVGWFLSGLQLANLRESPGSPPAATTPPTTPDVALPKEDTPGQDFSDLPRYPGSVRVEYRRHVSGAGIVRVETEYLSTAKLDDVRGFYRDVFRSEGWTVASFDVSEGEWDFFVVKGDREAMVEIEPLDGLLDVEIEVSEPEKDRAPRNRQTAPPQGSQQAATAPASTPPSASTPTGAPPSEADYDSEDDYDGSHEDLGDD
jgi:hypothetical protein